MPAPAEVITALKHVREFHPTVIKVSYNRQGLWKFMDKDNNCPVFGEEIDQGILEDAVDSINFPCTFEIEN